MMVRNETNGYAMGKERVTSLAWEANFCSAEIPNL